MWEILEKIGGICISFFFKISIVYKVCKYKVYIILSFFFFMGFGIVL